MEKNCLSPDKLELLKLEYQICHEGYNVRDQITEDEFSKLIQIFSIFLTVIFAFNLFIKIHIILHIMLCIIIGIAGCLSMVALLLDMESASSCKIALRNRCLEIEKQLVGQDIFKYWGVIEKREKYPEERFLKGGSGKKKDRKETEGDLFIFSSRILIGIWVVIVFTLAICGNSIELSTK